MGTVIDLLVWKAFLRQIFSYEHYGSLFMTHRVFCPGTNLVIFGLNQPHIVKQCCIDTQQQVVDMKLHSSECAAMNETGRS